MPNGVGSLGAVTGANSGLGGVAVDEVFGDEALLLGGEGCAAGCGVRGRSAVQIDWSGYLRGHELSVAAMPQQDQCAVQLCLAFDEDRIAPLNNH